MLAPIISLFGTVWGLFSVVALILVNPFLINLAICLSGVILVHEIAVILDERDVNRRAVGHLHQLGAVPDEQIPMARELLDAASKTYVAHAPTGWLSHIIYIGYLMVRRRE